MKLVSDFSDYYDHQFDLDGPEFRRVTTDGPDRVEQFRLLTAMGLSVPPHGKVKDIADMWWEDEKQWVKWVVVYHDLAAHCGEGKLLTQTSQFKWDGCLSRQQELWRKQELFCSAYVGSFPSWQGYSWRMLQVGPHRFWVEYSSLTDWRSNCGEGDCEIIGVEMNVGAHHGLGIPLFAIDFVLGKEAYAVDLNVAPGVRGTGVERYLTPKAFVEALKCKLPGV